MIKPRLFAIGYAREGFGFGRVIHSIFHYLTDQYEIHQFERSSHVNPNLPWKVYPNRLPGDIYGERQLPALIDQICPQLIFFVGEIWDVPIYINLSCKHRWQSKLVAYCAVEGPLKSNGFLATFGSLSRLILYTDFAQREINKGFTRLREDVGYLVPPTINVIPHGVDTNLFWPYQGATLHEKRRQARRELFPGMPEMSEDFIVFNGNRNQTRKRVDLTLQGFRIFSEDKPKNVKLYLHMGVIDRGVNFLGLARRYKIQDRLLYTTTLRNHPFVSDRVLNCIYNACDVGVNTACAEGWGLVSFEHAATKAAQIVPRYCALEHLWANTGFLLDTKSCDDNHYPVVLREVSPVHLASTLQRLYDTPSLLESMSNSAFKNAMRREYQWSHIAMQFHELFQDTLGTSKK